MIRQKPLRLDIFKNKFCSEYTTFRLLIFKYDIFEIETMLNQMKTNENGFKIKRRRYVIYSDGKILTQISNPKFKNTIRNLYLLF